MTTFAIANQGLTLNLFACNDNFGSNFEGISKERRNPQFFYEIVGVNYS